MKKFLSRFSIRNNPYLYIIALLLLFIFSQYKGNEYWYKVNLSIGENSGKLIDENYSLKAQNIALGRSRDYVNGIPYKKTSDPVAFNCYNFIANKAPDTQKMISVKKDLLKQKGLPETICTDTQNTAYIVTLREKEPHQVYGIKQLVVMLYRFSDQSNYFSYTLYRQDKEIYSQDTFKLIEWSKEGDILYSIIEGKSSYQSFIYVMLAKSYVPSLVEHCMWGVGEKQEKGFKVCKPILDNSLYLKNSDLVGE